MNKFHNSLLLESSSRFNLIDSKIIVAAKYIPIDVKYILKAPICNNIILTTIAPKVNAQVPEPATRALAGFKERTGTMFGTAAILPDKRTLYLYQSTGLKLYHNY